MNYTVKILCYSLHSFAKLLAPVVHARPGRAARLPAHQFPSVALGVAELVRPDSVLGGRVGSRLFVGAGAGGGVALSALFLARNGDGDAGLAEETRLSVVPRPRHRLQHFVHDLRSLAISDLVAGTAVLSNGRVLIVRARTWSVVSHPFLSLGANRDFHGSLAELARGVVLSGTRLVPCLLVHHGRPLTLA